MKEHEAETLHVVTENVALPEIQVGAADVPDEADSTAEIDYSGAIPQIHFGKKPEKED